MAYLLDFLATAFGMIAGLFLYDVLRKRSFQRRLQKYYEEEDRFAKRPKI